MRLSENLNSNCAQTFFSYYPFIIVITCIVIVHLSAEQITITSYTMHIIHIQLILGARGKRFCHSTPMG